MRQRHSSSFPHRYGAAAGSSVGSGGSGGESGSVSGSIGIGVGDAIPHARTHVKRCWWEPEWELPEIARDGRDARRHLDVRQGHRRGTTAARALSAAAARRRRARARARRRRQHRSLGLGLARQESRRHHAREHRCLCMHDHRPWDLRCPAGDVGQRGGAPKEHERCVYAQSCGARRWGAARVRVGVDTFARERRQWERQ
ncbi:hypothetical protein DFH06DRAFT_159032 [Mycena polygramma]|nr:hypothetical protein DFH06DRAFT_159032 [Mycena polygramma]